MSQSLYQIPSPIGKALSRLPAYPGSVLFAGALNFALTRHIPADTLEALDGRPISIDVKDARVRFDIVCKNGSFCAARNRNDVHLVISANTYDFVLLAQRKEDPDTLFFSRRLTMEGDTELGLLVKNSLDAIDLSTISLGRFFPVHIFRPSRSEE